MKVTSSWTGVTRRQLKSLSPPEKQAQILDLFEPGQLTVGQALKSLADKASEADLLQFAGSAGLVGTSFLGAGALGFGASFATLATLGAVGGVSALAAAVGFVRKRSWQARASGLSEEARRVSDALLTPAGPGAAKDSRFLNDGLFENVHELFNLQTGQILKREAILKTPVPVKFTEDPEKGRVTVEFDKVQRELEGSLTLPTGEHPLLTLQLPPDPKTGDQAKQTFAADGTSRFEYFRSKDFFDAPYAQWWPGTYTSPTEATDSQGGVVDTAKSFAFRPLVSTVETGQALGTQNPGEFAHKVTPLADGSWKEIRALSSGPLQPGQWTKLNWNVRQAAVSFSMPGLHVRQNVSSPTVSVNGKDIPGELKFEGDVRLQTEGVTQRLSFRDTNDLEFSGVTGRVRLRHPKGESPRAELFWGSTSRGPVSVEWDGQQYKVEGRTLRPPVNLHEEELSLKEPPSRRPG